MSFEVPAAREPAPRPGQPAPPAQPATVSVAVASTSDLTAGGRAEFTYALSDANGNPLPASAHPVTWSAANAATTAIIDTDGSVDPARQSDGAFGFDLADNAAPGEYRVTVATAAADNAASGSVSFTIRGGPAAYAITGPDTVPPGGYAVYQVTVTDANGATPILTERAARRNHCGQRRRRRQRAPVQPVVRQQPGAGRRRRGPLPAARQPGRRPGQRHHHQSHRRGRRHRRQQEREGRNGGHDAVRRPGSPGPQLVCRGAIPDVKEHQQNENHH